MIKNYKELHVWQRSMELVRDIYVITRDFPKNELFGLVSQMRRSAVSIPSNVAEGWMRQHAKEYIQFLYHALGSCGELDTQIIIAVDIGYMRLELAKDLHEKINHISRMLYKLSRALRSR